MRILHINPTISQQNPEGQGSGAIGNDSTHLIKRYKTQTAPAGTGKETAKAGREEETGN